MEKISAVIITLDAEIHLKKVLENIHKIVDEIIIVDSGSKDKTLDIAQEYKAKIIKKNWLGYGRQKNLGILYAKNDWILSLDADEVIDSELAQSIKVADNNKYDGYYIAFKNHFMNKWVKYGGWYPDWHLRLFKKSKMRFQEKEVHEQVKPEGKTGYLKGNVLHYTYSSTRHYFEKIEKYTDLDAQYLLSKNRKWSVLYQFGKPIKEFVEMYFIKKGFSDGSIGLKIAYYSAIYRYKVALKLKESYENNGKKEKQ